MGRARWNLTHPPKNPSQPLKNTAVAKTQMILQAAHGHPPVSGGFIPFPAQMDPGLTSHSGQHGPQLPIVDGKPLLPKPNMDKTTN